MTKAVLVKNIPGLEEVIVVNVRSDLPEIGHPDVLYLVKMDETNNNQPALYVWVDGQYSKVSGAGSNDSGGYSYQQITKLGVTATPTNPKTYEILIPKTFDFLRHPIEVLKFSPAQQNVVSTEIAFDNSDATDFEPNENVTFNGVMKLKTEYFYEMTNDNTWKETGTILKTLIDRSPFKKIDKLQFLI